jgi:hypothetical protein
MQSKIRVWSVFEIISTAPLEWVLCWDFVNKLNAKQYIEKNTKKRNLVFKKREVVIARFIPDDLLNDERMYVREARKKYAKFRAEAII